MTSINAGSRSLFRQDAGAGVVSTILLIPILIMFAQLIVMGGRVAGAKADMNAAASEAARQGSVSQSPDSAQAMAGPVALKILQDRGAQCTSPTAGMASGTSFTRGGVMAVEVTCTVDLSDLGFLPLPNGATIEMRTVAFEAVDLFRFVKDGQTGNGIDDDIDATLGP